MKTWVLLASTVLATASLTAQTTFTWNGLASKNWTGANWSEGTPLNDGTDDIHMAGNNRLNNRANGGWDIHSLTFDAGASSFIIAGFFSDEVMLEGGGIVNNSAALQTVNHALLLNANETINAAAGNLSLGGSISLYDFSASVPGAKDVVISGGITGNGGLLKSGVGKLTLSGNNSFSGGINATGGRLVGANNLAFGNGAVTLTGGAKLEGAASARAFANNVMISGNAKIGGPVDVTLTSGLKGSGVVTKEDAATLTINGVGGFSGSITVAGGTVVADGKDCLGSVSGVVVDSGGSLKLVNTAGNAVIDSAPLTLNAGGELVLNDQIEKFGALTVTGTGKIVMAINGANGSLTFSQLNIGAGDVLMVQNWTYEIANPVVTASGDGLFSTLNPGSAVLANVLFDGIALGANWNPLTGELTPIPEPNALLVILAGFLGLVMFNRCRKD